MFPILQSKHANNILVTLRRVALTSAISFFSYSFFPLEIRLKLVRCVPRSSPLFENRPRGSARASPMPPNRLPFSPRRASLIKPPPFSLCSSAAVQRCCLCGCRVLRERARMCVCLCRCVYTALGRLELHTRVHVSNDATRRFESS